MRVYSRFQYEVVSDPAHCHRHTHVMPPANMSRRPFGRSSDDKLAAKPYMIATSSQTPGPHRRNVRSDDLQTLILPEGTTSPDPSSSSTRFDGAAKSSLSYTGNIVCRLHTKDPPRRNHPIRLWDICLPCSRAIVNARRRMGDRSVPPTRCETYSRRGDRSADTRTQARGAPTRHSFEKPNLAESCAQTWHKLRTVSHAVG